MRATPTERARGRLQTRDSSVEASVTCVTGVTPPRRRQTDATATESPAVLAVEVERVKPCGLKRRRTVRCAIRVGRGGTV